MLKSSEEVFSEALSVLALRSQAVPAQIHATTCIGLVNQGGVIVAADSRASAMGGQIVSESFNKIIELDAYSVIAVSGAVNLAQKISRFLRGRFSYEADLYEGQIIPPKTKLNLIRNTIDQAMGTFNSSVENPIFISPLFATWDLDKHEPGGRIFKILPDLSLTPEEQLEAVGSGSTVAVPVLETLLAVLGKLPLRNDLRKVVGYDEAIHLVITALLSSSAKDSHTGENIKVVGITSNGVENVAREKVIDIVARVKRGEVLPKCQQ